MATDYRSQTRRRSKKKILDDLIKADPDYLYTKLITPVIGLGLFSKKPLTFGEYLAEYKGDLHLEEFPDGTYVYAFHHNEKTACIDATDPNSGLARFANDEETEPNSKIEKVVVDGRPRLFLKAAADIAEHTEIRYDYGQPDAHWRKRADGFAVGKRADEGEKRIPGEDSSGQREKRMQEEDSSGQGEKRMQEEDSSGQGEKRMQEEDSSGEGEKGMQGEDSSGEGEKGLQGEDSSGEGEKGMPGVDSSGEGEKRIQEKDSSDEGEKGIQKEDSSDEGEKGLQGEDSSGEGEKRIQEKGSSDEGEKGIQKEDSSDEGEKGMQGEDSSGEGEKGLQGEVSSGEGEKRIQEKDSSGEGEKGMLGVDSSGEGDKGLRGQDSSGQGEKGRPGEDSSGQGEQRIQEGYSSDEGEKGIQEGYSSDEGEKRMREEVSSDEGEKRKQGKDSSDEGEKGMPGEDSSDEGEKGIQKEDSSDEGEKGIQEEDSSDEGEKGTPTEDSSDEGEKGMHLGEDSSDEGEKGIQEEDSSDEGEKGIQEEDSSDEGENGMPGEDSSGEGEDNRKDYSPWEREEEDAQGDESFDGGEEEDGLSERETGEKVQDSTTEEEFSQASTTATRYRIVVQDTSGKSGKAYYSQSTSCLFGRHEDCDIRIKLPTVSSNHAIITIGESDEFLLSNLSHVNPTYLNGTRVERTMCLKHRDIITVGGRNLRFETRQTVSASSALSKKTRSQKRLSERFVMPLKEGTSQQPRGSSEDEALKEGTSQQPRGSSEDEAENAESGPEANQTSRHEINVQSITSSTRGRDYKKIHTCYFCGKTQLKMARHLARSHENEPELASLPELPAKGDACRADKEKERKRLFDIYRNLGDFEHNIDVLLNKKGTLYVSRRPSTEKVHEPGDYLPCQHCYVFFTKGELWRHTKKCSFLKQPVTFSTTDEEQRFAKECETAGRFLLQGATGIRAVGFEIDSASFQADVLQSLHLDDVSRGIKTDPLLVLLGQSQYCKLGATRAGQVREKLRILGRLKLILTKMSKKKTSEISDFLTPEHFDLCVKAVQSLAKISDRPSLSGTRTMENPSIALKAGHLLKKVAGLKKGRALRGKDKRAKTDAEDFLALHRMEWQDTISGLAHQTLTERKYNKKEILPLTTDMVKLTDHMESEMLASTEALKKDPSYEVWRHLAEVTLARIICFNKRRAGEPGKLLINKFNQRPSWKHANKELVNSLQLLEKQLMQKMDLVEVLGKKNRKVPVLLTKSMTEALETLISNRGTAGVHPQNPYIFARGETTHLKGTECLKTVVQNCGSLEQPELLTSTRLRKYLATVTQIMDLSNVQLEELARHMGHELSVHRQFYRLQDDVIELAKVSKLLLTIETGEAHKFAGMGLDDIHLDALFETPAANDGEDSEADTVYSAGTTEAESVAGTEHEYATEDTASVASSQTGSVTSSRIYKKVTKRKRCRLQPANDCNLDDASSEMESSTDDEEFICHKSGKQSHKRSKHVIPKKARRVRTEWSSAEKNAIRTHLIPTINRRKKPPTKQEVLDVQGKTDVLQTRDWRAIKFQAWAIYQHQAKAKEKLHSQLFDQPKSTQKKSNRKR